MLLSSAEGISVSHNKKKSSNKCFFSFILEVEEDLETRIVVFEMNWLKISRKKTKSLLRHET